MRQIPSSERRAGRRGGGEGSRGRTSIFCCKQQILIGVGQKKKKKSITEFFNIEQHRKSPSIRDTTAYESLIFSRKEKNLDVELA